VYKRKHTIFVLLTVACFTEQSDLQFHPFFCKWNSSLRLNSTSLHICTTCFYLFVSPWAPGLIPWLGYCELCLNTDGVQVSPFYADIQSLDCIPRTTTAGSYTVGSLFGYSRSLVFLNEL
jgi:hypothetical protein